MNNNTAEIPQEIQDMYQNMIFYRTIKEYIEDSHDSKEVDENFMLSTVYKGYLHFYDLLDNMPENIRNNKDRGVYFTTYAMYQERTNHFLYTIIDKHLA